MDRIFRAWVRATAPIVVLALCLAGPVRAEGESDQTPPFPGDMSASGLAALGASGNGDLAEGLLPDEVLNAVRNYVTETRALGLTARSTRLSVSTFSGPMNVHVNNNAGDAIGETQGEVAVAVYGDTVVVGWNDSKGFFVVGVTLSGFGYSTDGGQTFTDGGGLPLALATDQAFGDPGIDTDQQGNWYYNSIYTRGTTAATQQQNISVHHGRFNGSGQLVWDSPVQASIGQRNVGNLSAMDKCLLACDRVTGNVYVSYTRFSTGVLPPQIEIVRSVTQGTTWDPPIVLDATSTPTTSKQAARPFCGPAGEVYVVWEKGANTINCPDGFGNVNNPDGQIAFTRSLNFGLTYDPFTVIGLAGLSFMASGPGDLRERGNEFPDIAVDRSGGTFNGKLYVTWHEAAPWTSNMSAGPIKVEVNNTANNNPVTPELFAVGDNCTGTMSSTTDLDYWQFSATQGQSLLFNLDPNTFNCGVTGTGGKSMRMRLFATQSPYPNPVGFPDSLLAASAQGGFADRIVWTCPQTGNYLVRVQRSAGTAPFPYTLRVRNLTFGAPNPSRDARDVTLVSSANQGGTWTTEQRINDDAAGLENRRPFVSADGLGHVHVFWHDSRVPGFGSNASLTSVFGTTSRDGGVTWTPNYCVTDELSFFSFNTLAVPNLGDYNQAASWGGVTHPAWTDQRLSTGDVRVPNTNGYSAGLGPEVYTTGIIFDHTVSCPADFEICAAARSESRNFTITNTGTVPDQYNWTYNDSQGWSGGPTNGTTAVLDPGTSEDVAVTVSVPAACSYPNTSTTVSFTATPIGAPFDGKSCQTVASFSAIAFDFTPNTLNLQSQGLWVTGFLTPISPCTGAGIDVSSIRVNGVPVDPAAPTSVDGNGRLMVKFNRAAVELTVSNGASVPMVVTGTACGHCFIGSDCIRVIRAVVTAPTAGSHVTGGSVTQVRWQTPSGVSAQSVAILYSGDDGATWNLVAHGLPNSGSYDWTASNTGTEQAKIAVVLVESADETGYIVDGVLGVSQTFTIEAIVGVGDQGRAEFALNGISPNPAKGALRVSFSLKNSKPASLTLFDVTGRQIGSRRVDMLGPGRHSVTLGEGASLRAGLYMIRLTQDGKSLTTRAALVR